MIAYSAKAGSTAQDGNGSNSPFTVALARHLTTPGLDVRKAFGFVRDDVLKNTANQQEPFVYGSLGGEDVALVPGLSTAQASAANAQAETRRDYELALQIGNKAAFDAFLAQHPDGFYASLTRLQLEKIAAEQAHAAAVEKANQAELERARLAAEGAQKELQAKAEADARTADQERIVAEKAKQVAQQQAADAERKRPDKTPDAASAPAPSAAPAPAAAAPNKVASLNPSQPDDLTKSVQTELRRVGCLTQPADGNWNQSSQRSLSLFNRNAGTTLDVKTVNADTLDTIKQKPSRVCPLACEHGFKADGDHCTRIVCADGFFLNDDNECEKRRAKTATRDEGDHRGQGRSERAGGPGAKSDAGYGTPRPQAAARPQAGGSGQIVCDGAGCRPVARGCHLEYRTFEQGGPHEGGGGNVQVCR